jgi:hypothetical protein
MSKVQFIRTAVAAAAAKLACFLRRISLHPVGIARATKGDGHTCRRKIAKSCGN